jgi:hypothetical protein
MTMGKYGTVTKAWVNARLKQPKRRSQQQQRRRPTGVCAVVRPRLCLINKHFAVGKHDGTVFSLIRPPRVLIFRTRPTWGAAADRGGVVVTEAAREGMEGDERGWTVGSAVKQEKALGKRPYVPLQSKEGKPRTRTKVSPGPGEPGFIYEVRRKMGRRGGGGGHQWREKGGEPGPATDFSVQLTPDVLLLLDVCCTATNATQACVALQAAMQPCASAAAMTPRSQSTQSMSHLEYCM